MIQFCISLWMFISSLLMNFFKTKTLKPILFNFTFEIVLACSYSSLRTIYGTNIFGTVSKDVIEVYIPWNIIIRLILRGEQSQKIF